MPRLFETEAGRPLIRAGGPCPGAHSLGSGRKAAGPGRQRRRSRGLARRDSAAFFLPTSDSGRAASGSLVIITERLPQLEVQLHFCSWKFSKASRLDTQGPRPRTGARGGSPGPAGGRPGPVGGRRDARAPPPLSWEQRRGGATLGPWPSNPWARTGVRRTRGVSANGVALTP